MRNALHRGLSLILNPLLVLAEWMVVLLAIAMLAVVFIQVVLRYTSDWSFYGAEELSRFIFTWFIFLSAAIGLDRGTHFAVDILVERFTGVLRRSLELIAHLIILFVLIVLVTRGFDMTVRNWRQLSSAMQVPMSFVSAAIPFSSALMILVTLRNMLTPGLVARETEPA